MQNRAIFFDRDGTINYDPGYLHNPEEVRLLDGVAKGIATLKSKTDFLIIVVSNQSGISRGYFTAKEVDSVNKKINDQLSKEGGQIDRFEYCPYHPEFSTSEEVKCRKPSPRMVLDVASELNIDLSKSYFVGDRSSDIECGINAGTKTVFIKSEQYGGEIKELHQAGKRPNFIAENFSETVKFILNDIAEKVN